VGREHRSAQGPKAPRDRHARLFLRNLGRPVNSDSLPRLLCVVKKPQSWTPSPEALLPAPSLINRSPDGRAATADCPPIDLCGYPFFPVGFRPSLDWVRIPSSCACMRIARQRRFLGMMTILLIVLILFLVGALPTWPHSRNWGYGPSGGLGTVLVILLILFLLHVI